MNFRNDINGLRAIAVLAVLIYHFDLGVLSSGFVGVDIFFVISGFLMTSIILKDLPRFSVLDFYIRRARRIIPALGALILVVLTAAIAIIEPLTLVQWTREGLLAGTFLSNIWYTTQTNYFAPAAETSLFLHTWSLSVEWQFYIIYPLVILGFVRFWDRKYIGWLLATLVFISLAASVGVYFLGNRAINFGFFMLPTRAWEMAAGGLIYYAATSVTMSPTPRRRMVLEALGLALCALSCVVFSPGSKWPYLYAVLPVGGAMLVIGAARGPDTVLKNPLWQYIGLRSYSLYLWHWPIIVFLRYFEKMNQPEWVIVGMILTLVMAEFSYRFIEQPLHHARRPATVWITLGSMAAGLVLLVFPVWWTHGFPQRARGDAALMSDTIHASNDWMFPAECSALKNGAVNTCGGNKPVNAVIVGDSHAMMWYARYGRDGNHPAAFMISPGCIPISDVRRASRVDCSDRYSLILKTVRTLPVSTVIISAAWPPYFLKSPRGINCVRKHKSCIDISDQKGMDTAFSYLRSDMLSLKNSGKNVVLLLPIPIADHDIPRRLRQTLLLSSRPIDPVDFDIPTTDFENNIMDRLKNAARDVATVIDPRASLCESGRCSALFDDTRSRYKDGNHLRASFVRDHVDILDEIVK